MSYLVQVLMLSALLYSSLSCYQLLFLLYSSSAIFLGVHFYSPCSDFVVLEGSCSVLVGSHSIYIHILSVFQFVSGPTVFMSHVYAMVVSVRIPRMASHKSFHSCTSTILIAQDHSCSLIVQNNKLFFRQD